MGEAAVGAEGDATTSARRAITAAGIGNVLGRLGDVPERKSALTILLVAVVIFGGFAPLIAT